MKLFQSFALAVLLGAATLTIIPSCTTSSQRTAVNSLFSVGQGVDTAYRVYLDQVVQGTVKTNDVPTVSRAYNAFQASFAAAVALSSGTNTPPTSTVISAATNVLNAINIATKH